MNYKEMLNTELKYRLNRAELPKDMHVVNEICLEIQRRAGYISEEEILEGYESTQPNIDFQKIRRAAQLAYNNLIS